MNNAVGVAVYERQKELNEIREALGLPADTSHADLLVVLGQLHSHWEGIDDRT